ncbi:S-layer homology domain-containing protein [Candidatus Dojkabacteria bacterium]|uniref:S-layer homology domain-containing protein n=1 Tax=Candidatus Dojkabacteria bacterium TaxID=2099670 RepID=A0A955RKD3_9BACT|nr:S-layer homology domain-containing protein [Candidatus Dojkabacteria bacterium]
MKISKVIILQAVLVLLIAIPVLAGFPDVPENHEYKTAIEFVQGEGIVNGYGDGTYRPANTITRAEFTKIIVNSRYPKEEIDTCGDFPFPDVDEANAFANFICLAYEKGVVSGYTDGTYRPNETISFGAISKIIANAFSMDSDLGLQTEDHKFKPFVVSLQEKAAIPLTIETIDSLINRGEMAEIVYRIMNNITDKETKIYENLISQSVTPTPEPTTVPECSTDTYNCSSFTSQIAAQELFEFCFIQTGIDIHRLDGDNNGIACESQF